MKLVGIFLILVVGLGCLLAVYSAWGVRQIETRYPPVGRFIEVDGIRLHYVDKGQGTPLVLLHGASSTLLEFTDNLLARLAGSHRIIAFDRPGFGYSERPTDGWPDPARQAALFHRALLQLGIERSVIVGHSWSGSVALAYALDYPQQTAGAVLLAGVTHPWGGKVYWTFDLAQMPVIGTIFAHTIVYPVGRFLLQDVAAKVFAPDPMGPDHLTRTGATLALRPDTFLANAEDCGRLSDFLIDQSRRYPTIQTPLLLITGDSDAIVPADHHTDKLAKQAADVQLEVFKNTGHALHHTHPEAVSRLIDKFADRVFSRSQTGSN